MTPAHDSSSLQFLKKRKCLYVAVAAVTAQKQSLLTTWQNVVSAMSQQKQLCFCIMNMDIASNVHMAKESEKILSVPQKESPLQNHCIHLLGKRVSEPNRLAGTASVQVSFAGC